MKQIDKLYDPKAFESIISKKWIDNKYFSTHDEVKRPFTVLLPPPNVTGMLHIGHALNQYIQDSIIRFKKLEGYDVFWITGMDHAGIATQSKVETILYNEEKLTKYDLGREKFLEKIWAWKDEYANRFKQQWNSLGLALDYERERFTLDKDSNDAVNKAFIELYNKGLIYKGEKAINWDPVLKTALSNIEVINTPTEQTMYYIKYLLKDSNDFLTVATVRTETMLSDVAVVYNPDDPRYKNLKSKIIVHPLTKKEIPLIADEYVDKKFGSGLMKLSAHAEVDIDIIKKHNLEINETIDKDGLINCPGSQFHKLTREQAREAIGEYLEQNNLLVKKEQTISNVGYSERTKVPVETLVMPQWFVKMDKFSQDILKHLDTKEAVKFYPSRFRLTLKKWMENVHDWTISRQLWWGHRIPAWYKGDETRVQIDSPGEGWIQDPDVLDTWFSSGLAPFSFLGWPNDDSMLKRYFPTDLLVTGYDIIFFWVARMYFFSLEFTGLKPFKDVLLHGLVRDEQNRKMSKSLNNGIDPMKVITEYGSDALRFFLVTNTTPGMDIRYSNEKIKAAWALCNKLWNITRYIQSLEDDNTTEETPADLWISNKLAKLLAKIKKCISKYELTTIGTEINNFIYNDFSSWYIELLRITPNKKAAFKNLKSLLLIVHPFLPFVTDYLFNVVFGTELLDENLPIHKVSKSAKIAKIETVIKAVKILRKYREDKNISKKTTLSYDLNINKTDDLVKMINKLANAEIEENNDVLITDGTLKIYIKESNEVKQNYLDDLNKKIINVKFEIERASKMLDNENFIKKAPKDKIDLEKSKLENYKKQLAEYESEVSKWS
ncbi:valine--tRNA ligase [Mycoplasmopsis felifaucium]|uniref:valine--tRNA ligase n=1 Tax=Mycoplasmopsis felifaucium TaxID=35768 RepID=UPI0004832A9A|nr:valine--tRNA ligase [Mycoplasmopsis felifaucium]